MQHPHTAPAKLHKSPSNVTQLVSQPISILSVGLTIDVDDYLPRLLRSIDHPIKRILILIGIPSDAMLAHMQARVWETAAAHPTHLAGRIEL